MKGLVDFVIVDLVYK